MAVDGNWNITMSTPMGERKATLTLLSLRRYADGHAGRRRQFHRNLRRRHQRRRRQLEGLDHQPDAVDARVHRQGLRRQHVRRNGHRPDGQLSRSPGRGPKPDSEEAVAPSSLSHPCTRVERPQSAHLYRVTTISASPGRTHRAAASLPGRSPRRRARQSPQRRRRARRQVWRRYRCVRGQPSVDVPDPFPLEQRAAKVDSSLGFLRRQRPACVQAQENQFGMRLPNVARAIGADECIDLDDLRPEMPELARHPLLAAAQRISIGGVGIGEFRPQPAPRAGEHA